MAFDYASLRDETVQPLITKFGDDATLTIPGAPLGEPYDSRLDTATDYPVKVVRSRFMQTHNSGTLVQEKDSLFLLSTEGVSADPSLASRMAINGTIFQIIRIDPVKPGPVGMLWKVHCRK